MNSEVDFANYIDDVAVGRIGLHQLDLQHKKASIGYCLIKGAEGKGSL